MRTEQEIFGDLATLCTRPGYAHVIAFFSYRDNIVAYKDELRGKDYSKLFSTNRLIRTEISTLFGLMVRAPIIYTLPWPLRFETLVDQTERLLVELHEAMNQPFLLDFNAAVAEQKENPFTSAEAMREPIFYGPESAYSFQYRDLAAERYALDESWLRQNKGFSIDEARRIVSAILSFLHEKLPAVLQAMKDQPIESWSAFEGFAFTVADIANICKMSHDLVNKVLSAFSFADDGNPTFTALHEFNATNAYPLLKRSATDYILFQYVSLTEAIYDTPFYWMVSDKAYQQVAMTHRGAFTEKLAADRLERVFGPDRVFRNVHITHSKGSELGEIDVLVLFGTCAIVVQAKSKKLTLNARKGNDLQLQGDFKAAVQDACDQACGCSRYVSTEPLIDGRRRPVKVSKPIKRIYPICVVADHYPALSFQARQFLKYETNDFIRAPLICDVFTLDAITEMLETPLRCLSYLELRAIAGSGVFVNHEITALGYHLKQNLWLGKFDFMQLGDDLSTDVDIAMAVRRDGIEGDRVPPGILTELSGFTAERIIRQLERRLEPWAIELGLELLKLGGGALRDLSLAIDNIVADANRDFGEHNLTIAFDEGRSGLTVHCSERPDLDAALALRKHCEVRKYGQRATTWFGMLIRPSDGTLRLGQFLDYPWIPDRQMERAIAKIPKAMTGEAFRRALRNRRIAERNVQRNGPCPCGSGLKYKKCCLPTFKK
jgi:hypothetical protein